MKEILTIEEYLATRSDITPEMIEEGRLLTEAKIKGYELQQARKACRMTQKEVAAKMGVSQKRISDLENGSIDVMQVDTLRRYITSLGGTLEIKAILPEVSLDLQGLGTDHPLFS
ncbi:XRE family transcriptional regulator [Eggerthella guodeyinii]|uniref:XRE family transcriptional regulator n=1 Tax=Eggerthella guodeyinii TaxID=2690837 RepID=A0A6L7IRP0_9ACTN|nr:XRE family transcriptional regulator [Eggerthella guodeyinii]QOS67050.1 XRE family transcriptional regulator [Eggerthella guodeyinii]